MPHVNEFLAYDHIAMLLEEARHESLARIAREARRESTARSADAARPPSKPLAGRLAARLRAVIAPARPMRPADPPRRLNAGTAD